MLHSRFCLYYIAIMRKRVTGRMEVNADDEAEKEACICENVRRMVKVDKFLSMKYFSPESILVGAMNRMTF